MSLGASETNGDVRLAGGRIENGYASGRVELYLDGQWGTMDGGDIHNPLRSAAVAACHQLQYYAPHAVGTAETLK